MNPPAISMWKPAARLLILLFAKQAERGMTLVLVTHDPVLAARCSRQVRVASGQITADVTNNEKQPERQPA